MEMEELTEGVGRGKGRRKAGVEESADRVLTKVSEAVLAELAELKVIANGAAEDFAVGIETQAERHGMARAALRRYVQARVNDTLEKMVAETQSAQLLLGLE